MTVLTLIGILVNTLLFGYMVITRDGLWRAIHMPLAFNNVLFDAFMTILYWSSFLLIFLSSNNFILNIIICLLMQMLVNHIIWGLLTGIIEGKRDRYKI